MSCLPKLVILVLTLTAQVAGDCSVYDTLQSSSTDRCRQVQDCIDEAFFSNGNNIYFLDKVFRSTQSRTPVALIVNYHVTVSENNNHKVNDIDLGTSASGSGSANESNWMTMEAEEDTHPLETVSYIVQIGWSTTGIYKAIRPEVLVALQPAWYWRTVGRAIVNYSFPRSIHFVLDLNATKCDLLGHITRYKITEALEHLTMNLNYNTTGKTAYIWNINTNSLQPEENVLFITIVIMGIFLFVLLTALLPKLHHTYYSKKFWDSGGLEALFAVMLLIEIYYHLLFRIHLKMDLYSNIRGKLEDIVIAVASFGGLYGFAAGCYYGKCSCKGIVRTTNNFCSIYTFVICFAAYSLPVLIEAFIYPTEVISTIGFIMIGIATISAGYTILKQYNTSDSYSKSTSSMTKYWHRLQMWLICFCLYFIVPAAVYVSLVFYLSLLKLLLKSPTSQLFQLILTLVPVMVGICSLAVEKKLGNKNRANHQKESAKLDSDNSDDETNNVRERRQQKQGYHKLANEEVDEPQDTTNTGTHEQSQPERRQLRKRVQVDNRRHERQQAPQESSSQVQIEVEPNQDNSTENESTI